MPDGSRPLPAPMLRADPPADDAIACILAAAGGGLPLDTIALVNRQIGTWTNNGMLAQWQAGAGVPAAVAQPLQDFVQAACALPAWADTAKIARAEALFMDMSMMSCTLLFCASLPECYVMPDLAGVLHVAGQLEEHCDYRVRSTAAMIFPVMLRGGLTDPQGAGVAQVLKVRLIHATIRHLILRGDPATAQAAGPVGPLPVAGPGIYQKLYANGWDVQRHGLPCNQEELAYTLLTFSYIFLRGLRRLGLGVSTADEEAYLHAWNVVGHILGIERALMADTMDQAAALFERMQADARQQSYLPDPRPELGNALMRTMEHEIPVPLLKDFPVLLTRHLCGPDASAALGLTARTNLFARALFAVSMGACRLLDAAVRPFVPGFSLSRLAARVLGYRFTARILMDQTRPLKLPDALLHQVGATLQQWQCDARAPRWMNRLEAHLAGREKP